MLDSKQAIRDEMYWWLGKNRPFFIGDEYKIELLEMRSKSGTVKILITNLKTGDKTQQEVSE